MSTLKQNILSPKGLFYIALLFLLVFNVFQGAYLGVIADEAYYWVYSQEMAWGYFDHPPLVAVWIKISSFLFGRTEIGVRFFSAISLFFTFILVWKTLAVKFTKQNVNLFLLLIFSTGLLNVYGFITVPDTPLVLFLALFIYAYKRYLNINDLRTYALLIISVLGLLYSKHHTFLIVLFVVLSNLKLMTDYKLWICVILIIVGYFPHLYWQYLNDYPTFRYHLSGRNAFFEYNLGNTFLHIANCLVIMGLMFPIIYFTFFKNLKSTSTFQKGLNVIVIGFIGFFLFMSFRTKVQAQWVLPITIPLLIIAFNYYQQNGITKVFKNLATVSIILVFAVRLLAFLDIKATRPFHIEKKWVAAAVDKLNGRQPVVLSTYQHPSLFWFYSGVRPYQYKTTTSRDSQYDLFEFNKAFEIRNPFFVNMVKDYANDSITITKKNYYFGSADFVKIDKNFSLEPDEKTEFSLGQNSFQGILTNTGSIRITKTTKFYIHFLDESRTKVLSRIELPIVNTKKIQEGENSLEFVFDFKDEVIKENINYYQIGFNYNTALPAIPITKVIPCTIN